LPLAAFVAAVLAFRKKIVRFGISGILVCMMLFQIYQTRLYVGTVIHWDAMSKKAYWYTLLHRWHDVDYVHGNLLSIHDEELCRIGIYVFYDMSEDWAGITELSDLAGIELMKMEIKRSRTLPGDIRRYAKRAGVTIDEATSMTAERMLLMKRNYHSTDL
jgi:hypothetical protein